MLQHEPASEALALPVASFRETPVTPGELAQAIVTLEERQEDPTHTVDSTIAIQPILEHCGVDFTPEQVLAEVQQQRLESHQNTVMTRHRRHSVAFWLVLSGGILASATILFLLYTLYLLAHKFQEVAQDQMVRANQMAVTRTQVDAQQLLQQWSYPNANIVSRGLDYNLSTAIMTTSDGYAAVWKHYAQQVGYTQQMQARSQVNAAGTVPGLTASGRFFEGMQTVDYKVMSTSASTGQGTTFVKHTPQYTVSVTINSIKGQNKTTITEVTASP